MLYIIFSCNTRVMSQEKKQKFLVTELGRLYVVSRLHKDTHKVPLIGTYIQHSELPQLSITVPKNGISSPATISFQVKKLTPF